MSFNYWEECISEAFEDAGISATDEQITTVAGWVEGAHDNYGMALGYDAISNPMISEVEKLKKSLKDKEEQYERQLEGIRKGVAQRRNVHISNVNIIEQQTAEIEALRGFALAVTEPYEFSAVPVKVTHYAKNYGLIDDNGEPTPLLTGKED